MLRILAISSTVIGIGYNSLIALGWPNGPANPELWNVVGWLTVFLTINIVQSVKLLYRNTEITLPENERKLLSIAAPRMRTRDWTKLMAAANVIQLQHGQALINMAEHTDRVYLLVSGKLQEVDSTGHAFETVKGTWLGELSFSLNVQYGGAPTLITSIGNAELRTWTYEELEKLTSDIQLHDAFLDGVLRGLVRKRSVLLPEDGELLSVQKEIELSSIERQLHAFTFPNMSTGEVKRILALSCSDTIEPNKEISNKDRIGLIANGLIQIAREDQQYIELTKGCLFGEIAFIAQRDIKVGSISKTMQSTEIYWWDKEVISDMMKNDPRLYAKFIQHIARDMAIKLTQPLSANNSYVFIKEGGIS